MIDRRIKLDAKDRAALSRRILDLVLHLEDTRRDTHLIPSLFTLRAQVDDYGYIHPFDRDWLDDLCCRHPVAS